MAGVDLINLCIRNLSYTPHATQPHSPSARSNVHNGSPPPNLMRCFTLDRSILLYTLWILYNVLNFFGPYEQFFTTSVIPFKTPLFFQKLEMISLLFKSSTRWIFFLKKIMQILLTNIICEVFNIP